MTDNKPSLPVALLGFPDSTDTFSLSSRTAHSYPNTRRDAFKRRCAALVM